jgi:cell division protein FtsZ
MVEEQETKPRIVVVGVGGAGTNAVDNMDASGMRGVEFVAVNTDLQSLELCRTENKIHIGTKVTLGLGTGANPLLGEQAAEEDRAVLAEMLEGADLVFITCGLGGGTGTGASPVIADVAREMGALTVAICTKPFDFEGSVRRRHADRGQRELRGKVDTLITVPNQRLLNLVDERTTLVEGFRIADSVLTQCVQSIADLITQPGLINLDFSDIRAIMNQQGGAVMGVGHGEGENRALQAFQQASSSPLMEEVVIEGAKGLLINVTTGPGVTLHELSRAMEEQIHPKADPDANIIFGVVLEEEFGDRMQVTILATGFENQLPDTDISERSESETRSYGGEETGFERPAYLAKSEGKRPFQEEEEEEEEEVQTVVQDPSGSRGRRRRLGERSEVLPAIFGTGL